MRAVWIGLVGAVLAVGGAGAQDCPADRAVMRIDVRQERSALNQPAEHPEWAGREYRVAEARSNLRPRLDPRQGLERPMGYAGALTLDGPGGRVRVATLHTAGSPAVEDISTSGELDGFGPLDERLRTVPSKTYAVSAGPLAGFDLRLVRCEPPPTRQVSR